MTAFVMRRLLQSAVLLFVVSIIGFALLKLMPGVPLAQFSLTPGMTKEAIDRLEEQLGLNRPLYVQYAEWLINIVKGEWGRSLTSGTPVKQLIAAHLPATLLLVGVGTALAVIIGCAVGVAGAVWRNSPFDYFSTMAAMVGLSIPTFWFGLMAIYVFSLKLGWLPPGHMHAIGDESFLSYIRHLILPAGVVAIVNLAVWSRYSRSAVLDVLRQDFIKTARSKGLTRVGVVRAHVLRNAALPIITLLGLQLRNVVGGTVVVETIFSWPGIGRLFIDSLSSSDYPVVMGLLVVSVILVVIGSLLADIANAVVDPRIRLG